MILHSLQANEIIHPAPFKADENPLKSRSRPKPFEEPHSLIHSSVHDYHYHYDTTSPLLLPVVPPPSEAEISLNRSAAPFGLPLLTTFPRLPLLLTES
jgi:hypothetical protein